MSSLFDTGDREGLTTSNFKQQASIPEEERCTCCKGLGLVRWRNSHFGPDYKICFLCQGNGKINHELEDRIRKNHIKRNS
jgi:hypothetical protein